MRDALPHASFIGFTGTPIEKTDANTRAVFGDYISHLRHPARRGGQGDRADLLRKPARQVGTNEAEKPKIDPDFEEATEGEEAAHKEKLKSKWAALEAIVGADKRVRTHRHRLVKHWEARLEVMDGKAMIVCMSRRICIELYEPSQAPPGMARRGRRQRRHEGRHDRFGNRPGRVAASHPQQTAPGGTRQAIQEPERPVQDRDRPRHVADRLRCALPPHHVLDKPMRGHGLMQAIARVNRVFKDKPGGLVVDYLGLAHELKQALATYTESGGSGKTAIDQEEAVAVMLEKYEVCCGIFHGLDWSAWKTGKPQKRLSVLPAAQEHRSGAERRASNV